MKMDVMDGLVGVRTRGVQKKHYEIAKFHAQLIVIDLVLGTYSH